MAEPVAASTEAEALALDRADPLSRYRDRFLLPEGPDGAPAVYLAGQSLGLQPRTARAAIEAELDAWARLGIDGHFAPGRPWFTFDEPLRDPMARIVGARRSEVAILNTLTVNIHLLLEVRKDNTVVPAAAIQRGPQGTYVFTVKPDKTVELRYVTVAFNGGNLSAISKGLSPGEAVVTDGQDRLQNGSQVEVRGGDAGAAPATSPAPGGTGERKKRPSDASAPQAQ